jgi:hypothetical protein
MILYEMILKSKNGEGAPKPNNNTRKGKINHEIKEFALKPYINHSQ